jgi:hypothetical protein
VLWLVIGFMSTPTTSHQPAQSRVCATTNTKALPL